ncbi:hypothetical protein ACHHYP_20449 [Achlya hypogyna]|uniref:Tc1-like transposase DDE domain-containing protein n=1 Tax=Achlya hypogyna TaxID=1202772 RepID=A0A1V9YM44_ACHHY|nr:hypothetical protein ACHHYP_20449 [Achlya hypogyna]
MRRVLRRLGFKYLRGQNRNALAESAANVAYRAGYIRTKLGNRTPEGKPIRPEIYLDESFCNLHHVAPRSWLDSTRIRYGPSGKGDRFCIIGAGSLVTIRIHHKLCLTFELCLGYVATASDGKVSAGWVENSFVHWPAKEAKKSDQDYHGNSNAEQFERWFFDLCKSASFDIGACIIYLDGAKYHKRVLNPQPVARWRKSDIEDWIRVHGIAYDRASVKAELLELTRYHLKPPNYACVEIAKNWGHRVLYTPPYHPELQPIEII